jgi:hypothetical protein
MQFDETVIQSRCLEWHLGENANCEPRRILCGLARRQARFLISVNRLAVALAKSQDHRAPCGVFAFGLRNAVRRWLRLRYPAARASQGRDGGRNPRAGWLKKSRITQRRLAPYEGQLKRRANFDLDHGKATLCSSIHHRGSKRESMVLDLTGHRVYDAGVYDKGTHHG